MSSASNLRFNAAAASWDQNPDVAKASEEALQALLRQFPQLSLDSSNGGTATKGWDVLEIGCGTGLLSFRVAPYVNSVLAVDAAESMIDALRIKLERPGAPGNITPLALMLENANDNRLPPSDPANPQGERRKFDLIISHLVLHHIADLEPLLQVMYDCLKPGGWIALTDFEDFGPEARKFHPESNMSGVERHGVPRNQFAAMIKQARFEDVDVDVSWIMTKEVERFPGEWGEKKPNADVMGEKGFAEMEFPFLLCLGRKLE